MQDVPAFDPDIMLWISLGAFGLSVLMGIPMWWRNWRVRRGADIPIEEFDIHWQTAARWLGLTGTMGVLSSLLLMASRAMPFPAFMALCAVGTAAMILSAYCIDRARARH